ncbi:MULTISPECIES: hypothetical protein [unclassified Pseudonocardia]|uniref:hypothetical protein n=1 Tax=unclassified Pseudonocardia TaxID=2619320 RepID=UPI001BAF4BE6|nr:MULTISPECIES: hypothetical protein [unclassified Pseudonocardia]
MSTPTTLVHDTTLGPVTLSASPWGLTRLRFGRPAGAAQDPTPEPGSPEHAVLEQAVAELGEYLRGDRTTFEGRSTCPASSRSTAGCSASCARSATAAPAATGNWPGPRS